MATKTKLATIAWAVANNDGTPKLDAAGKPVFANFDVHANVKETLAKLGKTSESSGLTNLEHVRIMERGLNEMQSLFRDANEPTPAERNARTQLIAEIGVNTSQSRQVWEGFGLLKKSEGDRKRGVDAMALLD